MKGLYLKAENTKIKGIDPDVSGVKGLYLKAENTKEYRVSCTLVRCERLVFES